LATSPRSGKARPPLINTDDTDQKKSPSSRVIVDIARDRKARSSPLMNTDDTDQKIGLGMGWDEVE
jgi:hypothetical protein